MKLVWMVIVATTGAMLIIAASLLVMPLQQSDNLRPVKKSAEVHSDCPNCAGDDRQVSAMPKVYAAEKVRDAS